MRRPSPRQPRRSLASLVIRLADQDRGQQIAACLPASALDVVRGRRTHMLTAQENERLTRVGPGTPAGEWLRRYWHPIAISDRWDGIKTLWKCDEPVTFKGRSGTVASFGAALGTFTGQPTPVRILGEDLVLFRDGSGRLGLLGLRCPHRAASLEYGRIRPEGIECCYHGWLFDVTGRCLAQPAEPPESTFKDKVKHTAYPVRELGGLIWAYLGPGDPPILPKLDVVARD